MAIKTAFRRPYFLTALFNTNRTITCARAVTIKPITAYSMVFFAEPTFSVLPPLVTYLKPPAMIIMTAIIPTKIDRMLTTFLMVAFRLLEAWAGVLVFPLAQLVPHSMACWDVKLLEPLQVVQLIARAGAENTTSTVKTRLKLKDTSLFITFILLSN